MEADTTGECANCGRLIGKLETAYVWGEHSVCAGCYKLLAEGTANDAPAPVADDSPDAVAFSYATPTYRRPPGPHEIICPNPNCGYIGRPKMKSRGSWLALIVLLLLGILPGVLYVIFFSGYSLICPRCGVKIRDT